VAEAPSRAVAGGLGSGFALLGLFSTADSRLPWWWGAGVGAVLGAFFGCAFGGDRKWSVWDRLFGPEQPGDD
jgi:hypothetical protein